MHTPLHARQRGPLTWALLLLAALLLNGGSLQAQTADTYNFSATTGTYTPVSGGTTVAFSSNDDALSGSIPLPFSFVFDGNTYTSCKASTNGWLTFNAAASGSSLSNDLSTGTANERPRVAPFWDDLNGGSTGTARYATTGTAPNRVFTFEWAGWARYLNTPPSFSMQVQLVEGTNAVRFVYRQETTPVTGATASIGLSGTSSFLSLGSTGTSPTVSSASETDNLTTFPATGQTYTFTPPIITACPTPRNLNSAVSGNNALVTFTVTNTTSGPFTIVYGPAGFNPALPASATNAYTTITTTTTSALITGLAAQTTYQFYVMQNCGSTTGNSNYSTAGSFTTNPNPATNNECTSAVALNIGATCTAPTNGTVLSATQSLPPTTNCTSSTANDVWYSFVANGPSQTIAFTPQFASVLDVRSGSCTTSTSVFCTSVGAGTNSSSNVGGLTAGQTYFVRVYASGATQPVVASSVFTLCVTTGPVAPANDNCTGAVALSVGATCTTPTNGTVSGTTQSLPPTANCTSSMANDIWYSFVANGSAQTIAFTPQFAGVLDVRSGSCATSTSVFCTSVAAGTSSSSNVGGLTAGQTYFLRVYASGTIQPSPATSTFALCVTTGPATPANDECTNAVALNVGTICASPVFGTVLAAAQSLPPTSGCAGTNANDVWYSFVATAPSQTITFAPQFAGVLNVRSGACATSTSIFCAATAANATTPNVIGGLTTGQTYYVRVYASTATPPAPAASTFILCASGRPTAARAQADTEALVVFPNPSATGQLTLRLTSTAGSGQATLLNAMGQTVRRQQLSNAAEQTLSTRALAAGLYTLRVTVGEQVLTRKVVLE